ncbi:MAG: ATP-binding cassette domain-containing protein [Bacteroidales bacterium]|nr:ATP-binding cassette domain-containing protein [Bacteroidales bacterium]
MNPKTLISLSSGVISNPLRRLPAPASFELCEGECIAIVGPNGSGKSTLLEMIRGGFYLREGSLQFSLRDESYRAIRTVEFDNAYSTTETQYYYQQRWQAFEREASPLAGELLGDGDDSLREQLFSLLNIWPLLDKEIITLSSGELRRFSIARAMLQRPQVLILESPYIGLDPPTRQLLSDLLLQVRERLGVSVIMTLPASDQIPPVVTHVYYMEDGVVSEKFPADVVHNAGQSLRMKEVLPDSRSVPSLLNAGRTRFHASVISAREKTSSTEVLPELPKLRETPLFDKVVEMRHVDISYGERQIFQDLNWTVRSGEKWNVTGPNGSGKSTLLSLVNADNPRAYSLDITLFDRKRGTGESIWDIKRHIGYLSSEMHSGFITSDTVLEIVRTGLGHYSDGRVIAEAMKGFATGVKEGGDRPTVREQNLHARHSAVADSVEDEYLMLWLELFGAENLAQRNYNTLSSGEQRYVLLIRSFVKDPDLLILDEPFQGLDPAKRHRASTVIESFCRRPNKTLIFVTHYIEEIPGIVTHTLQL